MFLRSLKRSTVRWSGLYNFFFNPRSNPLSDAFFHDDHVELIEIYIFKKDAPARICGKKHWKSKFQNEKIITDEVLESTNYMMRGFQIWPQNSNRTTFYPLLQKKNYQKWSKSGILPILDVSFAKKGVKWCNFEFWGQLWNPLIVKHLLGLHLLVLSHFAFLTSAFIIWLQMRAGVSFFKEKVHFCELIMISDKMHRIGGRDRVFQKSCTKSTITPNSVLFTFI